jgi:phenylacetyl-CoA:acceptor oxidoreductase subunit 1
MPQMQQTPSKLPRWGMVVDINRCVGCQTCTIACKHANDTQPGIQWRSVLDLEHGVFPNVQREFLVVGCQHCAEPSCVPVCPSGATKQRADGLVTMDYDICIGCGYCAVSCPYQARSIVHGKRWYFGQSTIQEETVQHEDRIGVAQKCTFCIERVDEALEVGADPATNTDYMPACAASCIAQAITFGDYNNPESKVSQLTRDNASFQMHKELGNDPQIRYLYELAATPGHATAAEDRSDEILSDAANPLVGKRQTFWDLRAAANFIFGGMGSSLAVLASVFCLAGLIPEEALLKIHGSAGVIILTGLAIVGLEIGRKFRFLNVLRRPQTSWMTRETYCVAVFYPAILLDYLITIPGHHLLTGLAAFGFLFCQARILKAAKGIPAWRAPLIPWLIISTGMLEGAGLLLLGTASGLFDLAYTPAMAWIGVIAAASTGLLWKSYRKGAKAAGIPPLARRELEQISPLVSLAGHILPLVGFFLLTGFVGEGWQRDLTVTIAGMGAVLGGALWKFTLITRASYHQGYDIPWLPQRGSGTRAAPARFGYSGTP